MDGAMANRVFDLQDVLSVFQRNKVLTKSELLDKIGCSSMTIWRLLDRHGYLTSYNDNARHYTLADIPQFNEHGLWSFRKARFSKWGSMTNTIVGIVRQSPSGLTAEQLAELLEVRHVQPHLSRLFQRGCLTRERIEGCSVYFAIEPTERTMQQDRRKAEVESTLVAPQLPPLDHIVALMVEIIRRPQGTPQQWTRRLKQRGFPVGPRDIKAVLAHYEIDPKKGLSTS